VIHQNSRPRDNPCDKKQPQHAAAKICQDIGDTFKKVFKPGSAEELFSIPKAAWLVADQAGQPRCSKILIFLIQDNPRI